MLELSGIVVRSEGLSIDGDRLFVKCWLVKVTKFWTDKLSADANGLSESCCNLVVWRSGLIDYPK